DIADLSFVVKHADIVGLSFVRRAEDVAALQAELARLGASDMGVVLKIETQTAFEHLPAILLQAMKGRHVGVMIARGDLAVECGWERLAEAQEEILWVCEAAHVPVIWATQVLESLAKKGAPSRAEITDAAMGERAECVMLNKGPHLVQAVRVLDNILSRMEAHQSKKTARLRRLHLSELPSRSERERHA
ncbi:MAG: pyruvate kinase, partial [Chthoniobacterales bacterium]